ncbi:putative formamidopyrimidine-DNA glycosylase [Mycobacterium xenopi 3993]|nr:putative formamidopyrimidine-DNA glycosylase [Mycobacterium xenopi 3993]
MGKYLGLRVGDLFFIAHLSRAGWLRWSDNLPATPLRPGKGPIALRVHLGAPGQGPASTSPRPAPKSGWRCGWSTTPPGCPASRHWAPMR